jgi:hypothetical protein
MDAIRYGSDTANKTALAIHALLTKMVTRPTVQGLKALYDALTCRRTMDYIDSLIDFAVTGMDVQRVQELMVWLVETAPDREAVKAALAILGTLRNPSNVPLFETFAGHEEFTLFAKVALDNSHEDPEPFLLALAERLKGWGRFHCVKRLARTDKPEIKAWLLRDGYRNTVMTGSLAYLCATAGDLLTALKAEQVDPELLSGAWWMFDTMFSDGPGDGMENYDDGPQAVALFIDHLDADGLSLAPCAALAKLVRFLGYDKATWCERPGWDPANRAAMADHARAILARQPLETLIGPYLMSPDQPLADLAITVAEYVGFDAWPIHFARQRAGIRAWWQLMETEDPDRIDQVLDLARGQLDPDALATGPSTYIHNVGEANAHHAALEFIVQELRHFPGKGWDLISASLRCPAIRSRNMSIRVLDIWGRDMWPDDAETAIAAAIAIEPVPEVRAALIRLRNGETPYEGEA